MFEVADSYELDFGSHPHLHVGGRAVADGDALRRFEDRFGCTVLQGYELTATGDVLQPSEGQHRWPHER